MADDQEDGLRLHRPLHSISGIIHNIGSNQVPILLPTLSHIMVNDILSQPRFWPCHKNWLIKANPMVYYGVLSNPYESVLVAGTKPLLIEVGDWRA